MSSESCGLSYLAQRGGTARGRVRFSRLKTRCTIRLSISSSRRSWCFLSLRDVSLLLCLDSSSQVFLAEWYFIRAKSSPVKILL